MANSTGGEEVASSSSEEFYESLDRILSSSCSSTSVSDDEADLHHLHHHHRLPRNPQQKLSPSPFPVISSSVYDVWLSELTSVEDRRRRLLQQLDLIGDPSLSRVKPSAFPDDDGDERSVADDLNSSFSAGVEARSDVFVDADPVPELPPPAPAPPLAKSASSGTENTNDDEDDEFGGARDGDGDGTDDRDGECEDKYCTIKNLDNGEEFVVKEVREDGMWNKLKVVGTGKQLTIEEFQNSVIGHSPIVQELLRRQNEESSSGSGGKKGGSDSGPRTKKKGSWLRSIKNVAGAVVHRKERRSSDDRDTSSENGRRRSSSATDDSQDVHSHHGPERVRVRHYGKSWKELTGLFMNQEIHAHNGSIWSIKFSLDGRYLASAGEDCVIHIWQVEFGRKGDLMAERGLGTVEDVAHSSPFAPVGNGSPEQTMVLSNLDRNGSDMRRRAKVPGARKSFSSDHVVVPENVFALSEKPICSFYGHDKDVLDLSWSKSEYLLSSSMDKTVRLWDLSSNSCLKTFSHSDYVTSIQFNPIDDKFFISGSLDAKVRIWSIREHQVVAWNDLHEMVTAACYTPDGKGAFVGSHKGSCLFYNVSENKMQQKSQINMQNKKKKSHLKKITGFQFSPRCSSEVFITSADSRIRVVDDFEMVHKFKGFRNKTSQISASLTADGKHVVCASEDSHVYVWRYEADSRPSRSIGPVTSTQSYEHFHCRNVSVAVAWPGTTVGGMPRTISSGRNREDGLSQANSNIPIEAANGQHKSLWPAYDCSSSPQHPSVSPANSNRFSDRVSATWPEEKLVMTPNRYSNGDLNGQDHSRSAWGMVIVTAGRGGEIKTFQNFGYPVRV